MVENRHPHLVTQTQGKLSSILRFNSNNNTLTERIEEFGSLPPPQCLVVIGDDVIRLMFVNLSVEGHFIQEVVHLSQGSQSISINHLQKDTLHVCMCVHVCHLPF